MSSAKNSSPSLLSESDSSSEFTNSASEIIKQFSALHRMVMGHDPIGVIRLKRRVPDCAEDLIEISVYRPNPALAHAILKTLERLARKTIAPPPVPNERDPEETAKVMDLVRRYEDGSHPSCGIGSKNLIRSQR